MRLLPLLALAISLIPSALVLAASIPHVARNQVHGVVLLGARDETATPLTSSDHSAASIVSNGTVTVNSTSTSNTTAPASTTIASLNTSNPRVTPALGVGGIVLIATGAILALIGIRNLWIQVFLSAAFLTSLGVTVLIAYVMNPPVRVAIQGAYLVAIFFTGVTFGALSIVFKELTEGLGCLLGGFCTSMWLLCLKPGGLLAGTNAKSGFIGAISVAFYALSFSHYTRPYGLIASTGVAGGTAVALGIDCYSRAGLKEFWLYLWALNDDIFPLGTGSYPITRNIRVELAIIVIIAILGVVSQLRLWKLIRERRRKEDEIRDEEGRKNEEAEAEVCRRLEENNQREREEWEARYGNSEKKDIPELGDNTQCPADKVDLEKGNATEIRSISGSSQVSYRCSDCRHREGSEDSFSEASGATDDPRASQHVNNPDGTTGQVGPSQFRVFDGAAAAKLKNGGDSDVTATVGSEGGTVSSKHFFGQTLQKKISIQSSLRPARSQEAHTDDDSTLSVEGTKDENKDGIGHTGDEAAGLDKRRQASQEERDAWGLAAGREIAETWGGVENTTAPGCAPTGRGEKGTPAVRMLEKPVSMDDLRTARPKPIEEGSGEHGKLTAHDEGAPFSSNRNKNEGTEALAIKEADLRDNSQTPPTTSVEKQNSENALLQDAHGISKKPSLGESQDTNSSKTTPGKGGIQKRADEEIERKQSSSTESKAKKRRKEKAKLDAHTVKRLPERTSTVVQSYRTNEWAKHLCDAEIPAPEPIAPIVEESPENPVEAGEVPAPVNVKQLLQTPLTAEPAPAVESRVSSRKEQQNADDGRRMSHDSKPRLVLGISSPNVEESQAGFPFGGVPLVGAQVVLSSSALPSPGSNSAMRTLSGPAAELPREDQEVTKPKWKGPPPLLALREDMMRSRVSSTFLSLDPWASRNSSRHSMVLDSSTPISPSISNPDEGDDVPLSRRRAMLHQQGNLSARTSVPTPSPRWSHPSAIGADNAQMVMAAWRESIREDLEDKRNPLARQDVPLGGTGAGHRTSSPPLGQPGRNSSSMSLNLDQAIADKVQRGGMTELHRDAMRRMQAKANQNASG
ncbi:TMEM198/TM7SF3 family protein [Aspergillus clavatus NRRL 1]|uniref:TM7S3/TM198-like domain-containing protein n=1 Tax=Aspergillus clavatus (strain ATCC 1007 / CBS 513.65 / DSM 816 / NCTC 3887 / NRRL 1 / QM 1276 / 107) TaxID=344612 RepID=A1CAR4_ASPCL|nr:uncharacterized protein ACLA_012600 [Aspergillus clavatus NRRL 1]EAW12832.1 hypothetical protein ACLA_012600 [Aspergillus clavatus NRRL 1]